jgi:CheY-like chemotaxis protein/HPt (histidine-containing phosphotransfer) domain-containing protein
MEAIEQAQSNHYDLILMDHMMPEMDGIKATMHIRALGGEYESLPIIALTANAVSGAKEMFLQNGFNDFLSKPIDTVKLNTLLEKWIPKEKQKRTAEQAAAVKGDAINMAIDGVDVMTGVARTGGTAEGYLWTLAVFHKDGWEKIKQIKSCLQTDNLPLYVTYVHALKSAAASIGAATLSEAAKALETAGCQENAAFIAAHNAQFLTDLESLLRNIGEALSAEKEKQSGAEIDRDALKAGLTKLKAAIDDLNTGGIDAAVKDLWRFENASWSGGRVESILQNTLTGGYDEAVSQIESLLLKI